MTPISEATVRAAIEIIGTSGIEKEQIERDVRALVTDDMSARRLIDWIPEAFGIVLVSHLSSAIILPKTFQARSSAGKWIELPFEVEPVFVAALQFANAMFHEAPKEMFQNVSFRGSTMNAVNNALNSGASLDGARMSGPALIGIPADIYPRPPTPFWRRLFSG